MKDKPYKITIINRSDVKDCLIHTSLSLNNSEKEEYFSILKGIGTKGKGIKSAVRYAIECGKANNTLHEKEIVPKITPPDTFDDFIHSQEIIEPFPHVINPELKKIFDLLRLRAEFNIEMVCREHKPIPLLSINDTIKRITE